MFLIKIGFSKEMWCETALTLRLIELVARKENPLRPHVPLLHSQPDLGFGLFRKRGNVLRKTTDDQIVWLCVEHCE